MSLVVGLTGGIVSGKSTVAQMFKALGAIIIDADKIGHEIIVPKKHAWYKIIATFGENILQDNTEIDRKKLGKLVFSNHKMLKKLNEITHPEIEKIIKIKIAEFRKNNRSKQGIMIIDAPLIFEAGTEYLMDKIILVSLEESEQIKRLKHRNNLTREESLCRIKSQMSNNEKAKKADYVINNNQSIKKTEEQVKKIWQEMLSLA